MTPSSVDQVLQLATWFLALVEFVLAFYILSLNAWHIANRHVSALFLLFSTNSFVMGITLSATNATQAAWSTYILAATSPIVQSMVFLTAVVLLKPDWLRSRWARWPIHGLILLPILLTILDVGLDTQLWYTGLDAESYAGRYPALAEYTSGSLSPFIMVLYFYVLSLMPAILALHTILLDKKAVSSTRQLAWLVLGAQVTAIVVQLVLEDLLAPTTRALILSGSLTIAYAYAAFQQMISERRMQRGRLPIRLSAIILAIAVPLITSIVLFVSAQAGERMRQDAAERLEATNRALSANVSVWVNLNVEALQQLVTLPDIVSMDAERQKPILEAMDAAYPHIHLVSTTDLEGVNVARSDDSEPTSHRTRLWFEQARGGAPLTFQALISRSTDEPMLVVSMPIENEANANAGGAIVGVGMFASDLTDIANEVQASQVGEHGFAYIVDNENRVIAPNPAFSADLRFLSAYPPVAALRQGLRGPWEFTDDEGEQWQAYVDVLDNGWGVVVQQKEAELMEPLRRLRATTGGALISSTILLGVLASLAIRQALQPIGTLTDTATAIAGGDLSRIAPVESADEIGVLADVFNSMTAQLRGHIGGLEQRVADRTRDLERRTHYLEASTQVAHDAASVLEPQQLLERVVSLISERFGFYHAGIFLVDENREWAVLQAASSEGGRRMLARSHRLRVGKVGIVGYVTGQGEHRIALNVGADTVFFDNPDLPDTRSEIALPLRARGEIIGALDVQSTEPEAFSDEDVAVLQTLADQVAMAISNARLFQQAQESLEAQRRAYGIQSREAWTEMLRARLTPGYYCGASGVMPTAEHSEAVGTGDDEGLPALDIPVTVHGGQVIGTISARKPSDAGEWTAEETSLMRTLTERLNVALESARLYQNTQRRAAREQLIGDVTARIRETLDMETILKTAAQEVRQALGLPEVTIRLASRPTDEDGNGSGARDVQEQDGESPYRGWSSDGGNDA